MPVRATHFEIIGARPFWFALGLMPKVEDFFHLDGLFFPEEASRRLVVLVPYLTAEHLRNHEAGGIMHGANDRQVAVAVGAQSVAAKTLVQHLLPAPFA